MEARLCARLKALPLDELSELAAEAIIQCPAVWRKAEQRVAELMPVPEVVTQVLLSSDISFQKVGACSVKLLNACTD